jgi:hypothetical protein
LLEDGFKRETVAEFILRVATDELKAATMDKTRTRGAFARAVSYGICR